VRDVITSSIQTSGDQQAENEAGVMFGGLPDDQEMTWKSSIQAGLKGRSSAGNKAGVVSPKKFNSLTSIISCCY
jgi:hypothetical protein